MRLNTKEKRLQAREYAIKSIKDGATNVNEQQYHNILIISYTNAKGVVCVACFNGTSSKTYAHYRFDATNEKTGEERRAEWIEKEKGHEDARIRRVAQDKKENNGSLSSHAAAAKAMKAELSTLFQGIKFSCKSESFSGGNSVNVDWHDGPTSEEVDKIIRKYQYGHFNGMEDIYEDTNRRNDIPQVKYVSTSRHESPETEEALKSPEVAKILEHFPADREWERERFPSHIFNNTSIPAGAKVVGVEEMTAEEVENNNFHGVAGYYKLKLDLSNVVEQKSESKPTERPEMQENEVKVIEYGRGLAVIGNTKPIKDQLKALGGRFNPRLSVGCGWVFTSDKLEALKEAFA